MQQKVHPSPSCPIRGAIHLFDLPEFFQTAEAGKGFESGKPPDRAEVGRMKCPLPRRNLEVDRQAFVQPKRDHRVYGVEEGVGAFMPKIGGKLRTPVR